MSSHQDPNGTQAGCYLWCILICVNKRMGYGSFSVLMPYPPTEGRTVEFYGTPEGDFRGTIFRVHEAAQFTPYDPIQPAPDFGLAKPIKVQPLSIEFQVLVDVVESSSLPMTIKKCRE